MQKVECHILTNSRMGVNSAVYAMTDSELGHSIRRKSTMRTLERLNLPIKWIISLLRIISANIAAGQNSTPAEWKTVTNREFGFQISHPADWSVFETKAPNVRLWISTRDATSRCTVTAIHDPPMSKVLQPKVSSALRQLPLTQGDWADYLGTHMAKLTLLSSQRTELSGLPALEAIHETVIENIAGKFLQKQIVLFTMTSPPGLDWFVSCDSMDERPENARLHFKNMELKFRTVLRSFSFLRK
jgi:hypothetical protein